MNFFKNLFTRRQRQKLVVSRRKNEADVYDISAEDESMNAAMAKARRTLDYFKSSLLSPRADQQYFSLKARIKDDDDVEHIWLNDVSFDDADNFFGKIGNAPLSLTNVRLDQEVGIASADVSDWMIIEDGRLIGGYTIRAIRDAMTDKEKISFDQDLGMYIDEGVDYFSHDNFTPEGAILCLEDAYDARDLERCLACIDFDEGAKLLLAKTENMRRLVNDEEIVKHTAEALKLSFIKSMQNGFPDFSDMTRAFPKREFLSENLAIVTEVCFHPTRGKSSQRLYVSETNGQWKVVSVADHARDK